MSTTSDNMIRELEEIAGRTNLPLERRLMDTAVWFHKNWPTMDEGDVYRRIQFLGKALDIMIEMNAMLIERLHEAEQRRRSPSLYTPRGLALVG